MQASQIITDVRRELLETTGNFWSDSELLRLINRGQIDFVNKTRILEDEARLSMTVGRSEYPLPDNWVSAKVVFTKRTTDDNVNYKRLSPTTLEKLAQEQPNFLNATTDVDAFSRPNRYWIWNKTLNVWPSPDQVEDSDIRLYYKSKPRQITSETMSLDIDEALSDAITAYVLWKAWKKEQELDLSDAAGIEYFSYIKQGLRWQKKKSGDQRYRYDIESPFGIGGSLSTGFNPFSE